MIILDKVNKKYGQRSAVKDLSLKIDSGQVFGFLGQNGAGKTTTMKMIVGLSMPDSGRIEIGGKTSADINNKSRIGYMPEAPYFYDRLTGFEFLNFCGQLFGINLGRDKIETVLNSVGLGLAGKKHIAAYSKGMKQRLGFAQALINDPEYIFLDEPLDGLDPLGRKEIKDMIRSLQASGKTIFFNSHVLYDVEELCDVIGLLHQGQLVYAGSVAEFKGNQSLENKFIEVIQSLPNSNL